MLLEVSHMKRFIIASTRQVQIRNKTDFFLYSGAVSVFHGVNFNCKFKALGKPCLLEISICRCLSPYIVRKADL